MKHTKKMWSVAAAATLVAALASPAARAAVMDDVFTAKLAHVSALAEPVAVLETGEQVDDHLFDGVDKLGAKAKESSEVNLDKSMLGLAARNGGEKADLANKLDFVVVRSYEYSNEGDYNLADVQTIMDRLNGGGWKHLVRTREGKEMTDICIKQDSQGVTREMVIISAEPKEVSFIHLKGNVSMSDMHSLGSVMKGAMKGDKKSAIEGAPDGSGAASVGRRPKLTEN